MVAWLHELGHKAVLADCDSQNSSSEWIAGGRTQIPMSATRTPTRFSKGCRSSGRSDYIVCDGRGQTETSRALLLWADLAVIRARHRCSKHERSRKTRPSFAKPDHPQWPPPGGRRPLDGRKDFRLTKDMRGRGERAQAPAQQHPRHAPPSLRRRPGNRHLSGGWATAKRKRRRKSPRFQELIPRDQRSRRGHNAARTEAERRRATGAAVRRVRRKRKRKSQRTRNGNGGYAAERAHSPRG